MIISNEFNMLLDKAKEVLPSEAEITKIDTSVFDISLEAIYDKYLYILTCFPESNSYSLCTYECTSLKEV